MRKNGKVKMCLNCGKSVYVIPCREREGRGRYCSKECMANAFKMNVKEYNHNFKGRNHTFITQNGRRSNYLFNYIWSEFRQAFTPEHIVKAERIIGRRFRRSECVHHIDCNPLNNENGNLLICQNGYHHQLHWRMSELYAREHLSKEASIA